MNTNWLLIFGLLILTGCQFEPAESVKEGRSHATLINEYDVDKTPIYWSVSFKDSWSGKTYPIVMNEFGYFHEDEYNEDAIRQLASEMAAEIDSPMELSKWSESEQLIPGKEKVILSEDEFVEQLLTLPIGVSEAILPVYVTKPTVSEEDIHGIDEEIIGDFISYFNPHVVGRSHNIALSAQEITNILIGPGDSFSFNQVVGERTATRGYKEAMEIVNKEFVVGIGGGICQTSSTLFNAADEAGLEMIERFTHSRHVGYVAEGRDATVSWNGPDFRFLNPHPFPILIRSSVNLEQGEIRVMILTHKGNIY